MSNGEAIDQELVNTGNAPAADSHETNDSRQSYTPEEAYSLVTYEDVFGSRSEDEILPYAPMTLSYRDELVELSQEHGRQALEELSNDIRADYQGVMDRLEIPAESTSSVASSASWSMWDIAKQSYLAKHPDQSDSNHYELADPFDPAHRAEKVREMSSRHIGYEFGHAADVAGNTALMADDRYSSDSPNYQSDFRESDEGKAIIAQARADFVAAHVPESMRDEILADINTKNDHQHTPSYLLTRVGELLREATEPEAGEEPAEENADEIAATVDTEPATGATPESGSSNSPEQEEAVANFFSQLETAVNTAEHQNAADAFLTHLEGVVDARTATPDNRTPKQRLAQELARRASRNQLVYANVDQSEDTEQKAWEAADTRLTEELNRGGKFKRFLKGIWKGGLMRGHYMVKYKNEASELLQEAQNIHALDANSTQSAAARVATLERFTTTWTNEVVHTEIGEKRAEHQGDSEFSRGIKTLVARYVSGELNDESLAEEQNRFYADYRERHGDAATDELGEGVVSINNMLEVAKNAAREVDELLEIAQAVKGSEEHATSMAYVINNMRVLTAESRSGVRGKVDYGKFEKWLDNASKSKFGALVGPDALTIAGSLAVGTVKMGFTKAVTVTGAIGVGAGIMGYFRERRRVKHERGQHSREMAMGQDYEIGSKRREQMEATRYTTVEAIDLTNSINSYFDPNRLEQGGREALEAAAGALAAAKTRVGLSDAEDINLIAYSDKYAVERERLQLDVAIAAAELSLRERLANGGAELLGQAGLTAEAVVQHFSNRFIEQIREDMTAKDEAFVKLRRRRAIKMGLVVGATAAATSIGAHFAEQAIIGGIDTIHHSASGNFTTTNVGQHGEIQISDDSSIAHHDDGTIDIVGHDGKPVDGLTGLKVEQDGSLSTGAVDALKAHGMTVENLTHTETVQPAQTTTTPVGEFMAQPNNGTTHVTRDFWYDNNTPGVFERNELGLDYGGVNNSGVTSDGHYQYVTNMYQGGSIHGDKIAQLQQLESQGRLKLEVSATIGTQTTPFMLDGHVVVGPDGSGQVVYDIDPNSPAGSLYSVDNGHLVFHGAYAEAVQVDGTDPNGLVHVKPLATEVGRNDATTITHTAPPVEEVHPVSKITTGGFDTTEEHQVVGAAIPLVSRAPMELVGPKRRERTPSPYDRGYNGYAGEYESNLENELSPRLRENANADLNLGEELGWFATELGQREGSEYVARIQNDIDRSPELQSLSPETRTITTIPVAAASESDNIFNTLSLYAQQDAENIAHNTILLNVNWLDTAKQDPEKRANIDKTMQEIERARREYPNLKIAVMFREYEAGKVEATGGVIGYVASDLMNTALYALNERIKSGELSTDADVAVIRQDADMRGMSRHFLRQLEKSMGDNPGVDIFQGTIRSDVRLQGRYPGLGIVTNFSQAMSLVNAAHNRPWTVGINTVVRASTLAAIGGLGKLGGTGAGSDDVSIGYRVSGARSGTMSSGSYMPGNPGAPTDTERKIVAPVVGMTVDSAADRLIPQYLRGRHFGAAWNAADSAGTSFNDGPGGYRNRDEDKDIMKKIKRENAYKKEVYERIEKNMSGELSYANPEAAEKVLSIFFAGVPNAYELDGAIGSGSVGFKLLPAGKKFIRDRITREVNGARGAGYGARKMRQLYGQRMGRRNPVAKESALVSPAA